jgi:hypothetical protein
MVNLTSIFGATAKAVTDAAKIIPKNTATPSVFTNTTVNQNATFGAINITPLSAGASFSLIGGGSGTGGTAANISQVYNPISNVSTQVSNVFTTTNTTSNAFTENISNILNSPLAGSTQTTTPSTTVTPTVTPSQVATQTATPTITTDQTAGTGKGMEWWQYLIIGGVAVVAIYFISDALKKRKRGK